MALAVVVSATAASDRILPINRDRTASDTSDGHVHHRCLTPRPDDVFKLPLEREKPWSLPRKALAADFNTTINCLVLRFNFQEEIPDDPNTTGNGLMLVDPVVDTAAYLAEVGHFIDPAPHNADYFSAHMASLSHYWETVSHGKITLEWDIYPEVSDSVYQLPREMAFYGACLTALPGATAFDSVVVGLENYFIDCIQLADTAEAGLNFANYDAIFLFHAGSDQQNNVLLNTCSDLFTGWISFGDSLETIHDNGITIDTHYVRTALLMPERAWQDNRSVALNAVLAHEFGHQLGLVDLYSTRSFLSRLGDFALMDNNGFGTGIEFIGGDAGRTFGAIPVYPCAWSRAFLGFEEVVDFRKGDDIRLVAANVVSEGIQIARVPISENEYYLIENRIPDIDGKETALLADSTTSVIKGPSDLDRNLTGEFDELMPGSGVLIYHVDEAVIGQDFNGNGRNNFDDNHLQWNGKQRFIRLVEADGFANFGPNYRAGFGSEDDMFREDRNDRITPNSNPNTYDNTGNNSRISITDIRRDTLVAGGIPQVTDSVIRFDVSVDGLVDGFPVRVGNPVFALLPIADDLDGDGIDEIIVASQGVIAAFRTDGSRFLCDTCPTVRNRALSSVNDSLYPVPAFVFNLLADTITAGPVTGSFDGGTTKLVAVGSEASRIFYYSTVDTDDDGNADREFLTGGTDGFPIALSFGERLYCLTNEGVLYIDSVGKSLGSQDIVTQLDEETYHGIARIGLDLIVVAGDTLVNGSDAGVTTVFYYIDHEGIVDTLRLNGYYNYGPAVADLNLDGVPEVAVTSQFGQVLCLSVDTTATSLPLSVYAERETDAEFSANVVIGDVDSDGYPDVVAAGINSVHAFNRELTTLTDFPIEFNTGLQITQDPQFAPIDPVTSAPIIASTDVDDRPDIVFPTLLGNMYSFGPDETYGFPLSGGEQGAGSAVWLADTTGGKLGYLGADGWFYLWHVPDRSELAYWPMGGADPSGSFVFDEAMLPAKPNLGVSIADEKFYNYPNPVLNGSTTIRYMLGKEARSVSLIVYDLTGQEIVRFAGGTTANIDNEVVWDCSSVTPGVYRCILEAEFDGDSDHAFTDIAIIR